MVDTPAAGALSQSPSQNWLELTALCVGGVAVALAELLFARLAGLKAIAHTEKATGKTIEVAVRIVPRNNWFTPGLAIASGVMFIVLALLLWKRHKLSRQHSLRRVVFGDWRVGVTVGSFYVGTLIAALIRFFLGGVYVASFATGSAPIVAGILVGVIVAGVDNDGLFPWHRQLALMYLLMGALATALGTIPAPSGWFWGVCFLLIFGSLAASVCLTIDIVVSRATAQLTAGT
jgi:hypothetical protein